MLLKGTNGSGQTGLMTKNEMLKCADRTLPTKYKRGLSQLLLGLTTTQLR